MKRCSTKKSRKAFNRAAEDHDTVVLSGTPCHPARPDRTGQHGRAAWHSLAVPFRWPAAVIFAVHPLRTSMLCPVFLCLLFLELEASSNLYSSPKSCWKSFFIQTRRLSLKAQTSRNISIITSKEADISLSHLDSALKRGEIGIKWRLKEVTIEVYHSPMLTSCLSLSKTKSWNNKDGGKPLATLLRQGMDNQSIRPTYELKVAKSKCEMLAQAHVLSFMNSLTQMRHATYPIIKAQSKIRPFPTSVK